MSASEEVDFDFEPDLHIYSKDGHIYPSVTQVLEGARRPLTFVAPEQLAFLQARGQAVHRAIELLELCQLDRRTLGELKPWVESWELAKKRYGFTPLSVDGEPWVERALVHPIYRFGVRPDLVAGVDGKLAVVEVKATSAHVPATALQLAGQRLAVNHALRERAKAGGFKTREVTERYAVRLVPGREPDVRRYTDRGDDGVFLSFLNTYNWRLLNLR